ncbi:hypothetical protein KR018_010938 [Drosophila ironensis]|nr:hypothetical protein KR018_010938 [Drosophila ironensis]
MAFRGHVTSSGHLIVSDNLKATYRRRFDNVSASIKSKSLPFSSSRSFYRTVGDGNTNLAISTEPLSKSLANLYAGPDKSESDSIPSLCRRNEPDAQDYLRHINGRKIDREAAYELWYCDKQRQRRKKLQMIKRKRDDDQQRQEERKQLAQMCYDQWLKDKAELAESQRFKKHIQTATMKASYALSKENPMVRPSRTIVARSTRNVSQDEIRKVVESWWVKKQQQQQAQRQAQRRILAIKALAEERRKGLAQAAWQKWVGNVSQKPKPVPLNQGMDSLRATISPLYVNPKPWQFLMKPN